MEDEKAVSLITINLNGGKLTHELLDSIRGLDYPADKIEVIVVDNGSTDGSAKFIEERYLGVRLIRNDCNMGFAYPCNQGARIARGDYVAFVNNDVRLDRSWLREMLGHIDRENGVVCAGSKILSADGTKIDFIGGVVNYVGLAHQRHFGEDADKYDEPEKKELLFACGGAMLMDRKVFLDVGGFDEDFFAFFEDVDLGWRLWVMGYKVAFAPTAVAFHRHHQTAGKIPRHMLMTLYERNSLYTIFKNYDEENLKKALSTALIMSQVRSLDFAGIDASGYIIGGGADELRKRKDNPVQASYRRVMGRFLEILSSILLDLRLNSRMCLRDRQKRFVSALGPAPVCFSQAAAASHFCLNLPRMKAKRAAVQEGRKRSDAEIIARFPDSFGMADAIARYDRLGKILKDTWE